jgi:ABC-2 type transport system permease protein
MSAIPLAVALAAVLTALLLVAGSLHMSRKEI